MHGYCESYMSVDLASYDITCFTQYKKNIFKYKVSCKIV